MIMSAIPSLLSHISQQLMVTQIKLMSIKEGIDIARPEDNHGDAVVPTSLNSQFGNIANILVYLTGALSVIVLVFGGLRYVSSTGDAARVKAAKDTIMYGVIGLVVAILAYAIVNFVLTNI
jgi:hypothetical protein